LNFGLIAIARLAGIVHGVVVQITKYVFLGKTLFSMASKPK